MNLPINNKEWIPSIHMIPGTIFIKKLALEMKKAIKNKVFCEHKDITISLSPANVPGEGEQKLIPLIRKMKKVNLIRMILFVFLVLMLIYMYYL